MRKLKLELLNSKLICKRLPHELGAGKLWRGQRDAITLVCRASRPDGYKRHDFQVPLIATAC
jgi:hypothetical protein